MSHSILRSRDRSSSASSDSSNNTSPTPSDESYSSCCSTVDNAGTDMADKLVALFECPVCFDYVLPPILQCPSGHLTCTACRVQVSSCPSCRSSLPYIRNLGMEKVASNLHFPCKFVSFGCSSKLACSQKVDHETNCIYRPFDCPCKNYACNWHGPVNKVTEHLMQMHANITCLEGEEILFVATNIAVSGDVDWMMLQACCGRNFMLVLEKKERIDMVYYYAFVYLIGTRAEAQRYIYSLELSNNERRLAWEAKTRSIVDGIDSARRSSECLVFDKSIAELFTDNGDLTITVSTSFNPKFVPAN